VREEVTHSFLNANLRSVYIKRLSELKKHKPESNYSTANKDNSNKENLTDRSSNSQLESERESQQQLMSKPIIKPKGLNIQLTQVSKVAPTVPKVDLSRKLPLLDTSAPQKQELTERSDKSTPKSSTRVPVLRTGAHLNSEEH